MVLCQSGKFYIDQKPANIIKLTFTLPNTQPECYTIIIDGSFDVYWSSSPRTKTKPITGQEDQHRVMDKIKLASNRKCFVKYQNKTELFGLLGGRIVILGT